MNGTVRQTLRGIPKVPSLVFDLEIEEGGLVKQSVEDMDANLVRSELRRFVRPDSNTALQLSRDVIAAACGATQTGSFDALALAQTLTNQGYSVRVRRAIGGGDGAGCLHNLRHVFLRVNAPGSVDRAVFVVDPTFTDQFQIAKPTARYTAISSSLPEILVIPEDRIPPLVTLLCGEVSLAFKASNTVLPPWRQASSMLTKWLPTRSIDLPVDQSGTWGRALPSPHQQLERLPESPKIDSDSTCRPSGQYVVTSAWRIGKQQASEPLRVYGGFSSFGYISIASSVGSGIA